MKRATVALTKKEILAELINLGINNSSELHSCLWEYEYYALHNDSHASTVLLHDGVLNQAETKVK